jgi:nicotinate-nucleotide adenylyltransferase
MNDVQPQMARRVGLYFGSFNPIHMGHLVIANHMATCTDLDEVWLVVTPQSPHKSRGDLIAQDDRLQMVRLAIADHERLHASDVEFQLAQPNYTAATMRHLREKHPDDVFSIIIGEDNFDTLHKWQHYWELVDLHQILVYPRRELGPEPCPSPKYNPEMEREGQRVPASHPNIQFCEAPMISISSTYLREAILSRRDIRYLLPDKVLHYIGSNHLYED